jgi:polyisoprenoid-binding protein YceI
LQSVFISAIESIPSNGMSCRLPHLYGWLRLTEADVQTRHIDWLSKGSQRLKSQKPWERVRPESDGYVAGRGGGRTAGGGVRASSTTSNGTIFAMSSAEAFMAKLTAWQIDASHSSVEFSIKHMMFTTVRGRFKKLSGTIFVDEANADQSSVEVQIEAASIDTGSAERDEHLRSRDFLDVENFPLIVFQSKRIEGAHSKPGDRFRVGGNLTIVGRSVPVILDATFEGVGQDPWKNRRAGFAASAEIDRRDWGLEWNQSLETGGVLVGHTLRVQADIEAVQARAAGKSVA